MTYFWLFIVNQLVSASMLAMIAFAFGRITRNAMIIHLLWGAVFVKLLLPSPLVIPLPIIDEATSQYVFLIPPAPSELPATTAGEPQPPIATAAHDSQQLEQSNLTRALWPAPGTLLLSVWVIGTVFLFIRGLGRYYRLQHLLKTESVADKDANDLAEAITNSTSLNRKPRNQLPIVRLFAARISPMLFGVGTHSTIVCPTSLWNKLSDSDRKAFLGHELSHYFRRDHWVRWLEWLATILYWWFPLVYFARRQLERYEEIACDSWTVSNFPIARREYAGALLNVVDFLNESNVGVPRLASRMQATQNLEERLRRLLAKESATNSSRRGTFVLVGSLLLACPTFFVTRKEPVAPTIIANVPIVENPSSTIDKEILATLEAPQLNPALPDSPHGWWDSIPAGRWADFKLKRDDFQLLADAGKGVRIVHPNRSYHQFETGYIRSLSQIPDSGRFVIGNNDGEIHLWDADLNRSVSLIGKSDGPVISLSFHSEHGLASADLNGDIRIWDISSGQITAFKHMNRSVAAVRWSSDGESLYVVEGDWTSNASNCDLVLVSATLDSEVSRSALPASVAVVQTDERFGPLALDWGGRVWSLVTKDAIGFVQKKQVSGATLCEDVFAVLIDSLFDEMNER